LKHSEIQSGVDSQCCVHSLPSMNQAPEQPTVRSASSKHQFPATYRPANERVQSLLSACAHYGKSDRPIFVAGYNELCRLDLSGGRVLEVCCGYGQLAREMARVFPAAEIIAMDRYPDAGRALVEAREKEGVTNARYQCGDALRLDGFADASVDLIYGQATLHHLAHDTDSLRKEFSRVLKPGGRVVFIYEPLGHNPLWAMIRAYRIARARMGDESNVVVGQLDEIAQSFSQYEIQLFNFLGYPFKSLGRLAGESMMEFVFRMDAAVMQRWPRLAPLAANFNVIFTK
jgi:SAM-dependent methyltransferase